MSSPSSPATGWQLPPRAEPLDNAVLCNMKACSEKPKWIEYDRKVKCTAYCLQYFLASLAGFTLQVAVDVAGFAILWLV